MKSNFLQITRDEWQFLLEDKSPNTSVLVLVEEFQHEEQMIDRLIQRISDDHDDLKFYRLNTFPDHPILVELRIRMLPAIVIFHQGEIVYVSDEPLRNV